MREDTDQNNSEYGHFARSVFVATYKIEVNRQLPFLNAFVMRYINEDFKIFEDFKIKTQSPENVSINSHEVTCTQNAYLPMQKCPSSLTNNNSDLYQIRIHNPSRIIIGQININSIRNKFEQLIYIVKDTLMQI